MTMNTTENTTKNTTEKDTKMEDDPSKKISKNKESTIFGSFFLNSNEFALAVKSIQEVVNPPARFTHVPLAPPFLLGVFNLRGSVIPVVDLKIVLSLETSQGIKEGAKVAIVEHEGTKIGLLFDGTGEIFRNHADEISEFKYAGPKNERNVISGAIKLDSGKRIVQILDALSLVKIENVPHTHEGGEDSTQHHRKKKQANRKQCISFVVGNSKCGLGIDAIHEIIKIPTIKASALSDAHCMGMFDLRGDVVPLIDFAALLGYRATLSKEAIADSQRVIIMKIGSEKFGLLIESVESIITYYVEDLLHIPILSKTRASMFVGCLSREDGENIILLSENALLSEGDMPV